MLGLVQRHLNVSSSVRMCAPTTSASVSRLTCARPPQGILGLATALAPAVRSKVWGHRLGHRVTYSARRRLLHEHEPGWSCELTGIAGASSACANCADGPVRLQYRSHHGDERGASDQPAAAQGRATASPFALTRTRRLHRSTDLPSPAQRARRARLSWPCKNRAARARGARALP